MTSPTTTTPDFALAQHASTLRFEDLSAHTIERTKTFIADTLAVGVAGSSVEESMELSKTLSSGLVTGTVSVWGQTTELDATTAILLNAFEVHCQEYDCLHEGAVLHAMATLLPVLIAQAQTTGSVSGKDLITAVVAGTDVAIALGLAAKRGLRFFRPASSGGFGAVAGLARLRGYSPHKTLAAFGYQLAQASGTMQAHREGSPLLPLQASFNAKAAWQSCELAHSQLSTLDRPLTGEFGYLRLFEGEFDVEPLLEATGRTRHIDKFSHKPFPSGRATHGGIEGLMRLIQTHQLTADAIQEVVVIGPPLINQLVNRPCVPEPSANYARLCMPFVLAKILQHGELKPAHYRREALTDPKTHQLASKVRMQEDNNPDPNALSPQSVHVRLHDGQLLTTQIDDMLASPNRPLMATQCRDKFMQCCALSLAPVSNPDRLWQALGDLEHCPDVGTMISNITAS